MEHQFVWSYNFDPHKRTKFFAKPGDTLQWKRNGQRGYVDAVLLGYDDTKPKKVFIQNIDDNGATTGPPRWINRNSVLRVYLNNSG